MKRCFGVDTKLIDCDYSYVQTLRTVQEPHVPMPTLKELAALMCEPGAKKMWLLLDIKLDNDPDDVMRLVGEVFRDVGGSAQFWGGRIVLGCWGIKYLPVGLDFMVRDRGLMDDERSCARNISPGFRSWYVLSRWICHGC